jgi:hypothetical protein
MYYCYRPVDMGLSILKDIDRSRWRVVESVRVVAETGMTPASAIALKPTRESMLVWLSISIALEQARVDEAAQNRPRELEQSGAVVSVRRIERACPMDV